MFIFGLIIHLISSAVKIVPLGGKLDKAIGFISGVVKGLIVAIIVYFILYTVNMILRALGEPQIDEDWADQHFITKNYSTVQELLDAMKEGGRKSEE